ncbi:MAG TPA: helical backbone metal receptor [Candidatus Baltobacteraceae bacterium]
MLGPLRAIACGSLLLCGAACSAPAAPSHAPPSQRRIVALVPSLVEDLCAIGGGPQLVGTSAFTDDVPCTKGVPVVGDSFSVDAEKVVSLHPDLVLAIPAQQRSIEPLRRAGIRVAILRDDVFANIFTDIATIGALTGRDAAARALVRALARRTAALRATIPANGRRPTVFVALGTSPIYTVGPQSYIARLIALAGASDAVTSLPGAYGSYSAEALVTLQPDAIVTDAATRLSTVLGTQPWRSLRAVRDRRIFTLTDTALLERPGPRYNQGLQWLIERLAPLRR